VWGNRGRAQVPGASQSPVPYPGPPARWGQAPAFPTPPPGPVQWPPPRRPRRGPRRPRRGPLRTAAIGCAAFAGGAVLIVGLIIAAILTESPATPPAARVIATRIRSVTATLADPGSYGVNDVAFSPDGRTVAAADSNGNTYLWSTAARKLIATITGTGSQVAGSSPGTSSVAFSPDGQTLATGDIEGSAELWDTATHSMMATLTDKASEVPQLPQDNPVINNNPGGGPPIPQPPPPEGVAAVAFSPDGQVLAAGDGDGFIDLYNTATYTVIATLTEPSGLGVNSIAFSPDGQTLAAADGDGHTYLWNTTIRRITATLTDPTGWAVDSVAFSPDGRTLATADGDGHIYLWNTVTHAISRLTEPALGSNGFLSTPVFSPDGRTLATTDGYGTIYLWDIAAGRITATATDPGTQDVNSLAFSPDGRTLAAADANGSTYLWAVP
jgi:WD40 repeat protein